MTPLLRRLEALGIAACAAWVVADAAALPLRDQPIGTDWQRYLGNAVAIAEHQWGDYQTWRGPLHAFVSLAVMPAAGHLLEATQWVSMGAVAALVVLAGALGRRVVGPGGGLAVALLLAGWPDLAVQARMSTPYPLFAALVAAGLLAVDASRDGGWIAAAIGALAFGLAGAADARGAGLTAAALVGAWVAGGSARRAATLAGVAAGAWVLRAVVVARVPVQLLSLLEQVALQRDLHAREGGIPACVDHHGVLPGLAELFGPCGQATFGHNLARMAEVAPLPAVLVAAVAACGLQRRSAMLAAVCATVLPAAFLVGIEHRYLLPLAAPVAVLVVAGAARIGAWMPRPTAARIAVLALTVVALTLGWRAHDSLRARMTAAPDVRLDPRRAPAVRLGSPPPTLETRRWIREHAHDGSRIVDCAGLALELRLYPWPVDTIARNGRPSARCAALLAAPATPDTFVLARESADASWLAAPLRAPALHVYASR